MTNTQDYTFNFVVPQFHTVKLKDDHRDDARETGGSRLTKPGSIADPIAIPDTNAIRGNP